jgi:hypothetical protein
MRLEWLANEAMELAKLNRHLITFTMHPEYKDTPKTFFCRKSEEYTSQKTQIVNLAKTSEKALMASYAVAQRIAKSKKPHTIAEELILPAEVEFGMERGS